MLKQIGEKPTDQDKRDWAISTIVRRSEIDGYVYEISNNGKVYVLERNGSAPKKAGDKSILYLIGVVHQPEVHFLAHINTKAEEFRASNHY